MYKYYLSKQFVNLWRSNNETFEITSPNIYGPKSDQNILKFNPYNTAGVICYEISVEKAVEWAVKNNNMFVLKAICEDILIENGILATND